MSDNDNGATITLREVYDKVTELASTIVTHMSRQDTRYAVLEQRVGVVERDLDRHTREADKRHEDMKSENIREFAELRTDLEGKKNRAWVGYAALIGAAAAVAAALIPLFVH